MKSHFSRILIPSVVCALAMAVACSRSAAPTAPAVPTGGATTASDGSTLNVSAPTPTSPINRQQLTGTPALVAAAATGGGTAVLQYRFQVYNAAGAKVEESPLMSTPTYSVTSDLEFTKDYTWRVRAEYQTRVGPWSGAASFITSVGSYIHTGEVRDVLTNGATVGEIVGSTTYMGASGIKLNDATSHVRYTIPGSVTAGEFSMEVSGLRPNNVGDKTKVFAMSSNGPDFITDDFRVDVQYRGATGAPPNSITFRALYGSATDLSKRYEPDTTTRFNSVYNLNPATVYYWKFSWGSEARVMVKEGGINGTIIYNVGVPSPNGTYNPNPWYAYLGAPAGRSGTEAASAPGAIYRNVWISARARQ